jgi:hypothetical protein
MTKHKAPQFDLAAEAGLKIRIMREWQRSGCRISCIVKADFYQMARKPDSHGDQAFNPSVTILCQLRADGLEPREIYG